MLHKIEYQIAGSASINISISKATILKIDLRYHSVYVLRSNSVVPAKFSHFKHSESLEILH